MCNKLIEVHTEYLQLWLRDQSQSDIHSRIRQAIARIQQLEEEYGEHDIIRISPSQNIVASQLNLPDRVGHANHATIVGVRTKHCVQDVVNILDDASIPFTIDPIGCIN